MSSYGFNFTTLIRNNDARLAHNSIDDFQVFLDVIKAKWLEDHSRRASFNWNAISQKLVAAMSDVIGDDGNKQITSHDLLTLHEHLNRRFRTEDNSIACSDACQVALDMAIKAQHTPYEELAA